MDLRVIIELLDEYSRLTGLKPTTVCQHALGNARFYDRTKRRAAKYIEEAKRLEIYMRANPPQPDGSE